MKYIDLHTHSACSDGTFTPTELVQYAAEKGLSAIALTDHDTTAGLDEAFAAAQRFTVEVVAGIEFSTAHQGHDIHIVGLDIDYHSASFGSRLTAFRNSRDDRNAQMIKLLQAQGIDIRPEQLRAAFPNAVWTRAHFGRFLADHGYVRDIEEAFSRYLGEGCPCFVPRKKVTPVQAIRLIREAGGIPVLAHPLLYPLTPLQLEELVQELACRGLIAIEVYYSTHSKTDEEFVGRLAKKYDLCASGGSDFHGRNKPAIDLGSGCHNLKIPKQILTTLRKKKEEHHDFS